MEVTSQKDIIKKDAKNATISGLVAGGAVAGYEFYKQKNILGSPKMLEALQNDVLDSRKTIKEYDNDKGLKGILNKIPKFFAKRELGIKENMLENLSKKKISTKAITKSAAFFAVD